MCVSLSRLLITCAAVSAVLCLVVCANGAIVSPVLHSSTVYQVYPISPQGAQTSQGYGTPGSGTATAVTGILSLEPGGTDWPNFTAAGRAGVPYTIDIDEDPESPWYGTRKIFLVKNMPMGYYSEFFPGGIITQNDMDIRRWWPLFYELPETTFTLRIEYSTAVPFDDDGAGPNLPSLNHVEEWVWKVDVDLAHFKSGIDWGHQMPWGTSEVPLLCDEMLYPDLVSRCQDAQAAVNAGDQATLLSVLNEIYLILMDSTEFAGPDSKIKPASAITVPPMFPFPTGPGTGTANSAENPLCCLLMEDVLYMMEKIESDSPPDVSSAVASKPILWPATSGFVPITINGITDADGGPVTITITAVTSDERTTIPTIWLAPDANLAGGGLQLRAERYPYGNGRVYRVSFKAADVWGVFSTGAVNVTVPRLLSIPAVDDGQRYNAMTFN